MHRRMQALHAAVMEAAPACTCRCQKSNQDNHLMQVQTVAQASDGRVVLQKDSKTVIDEADADLVRQEAV